MAEENSDHPRPTTVTLDDLPARKILADGSKLLAETSAFLILEKDVHTKKCGAYANLHCVQLIRTLTDSRGRPGFKLVVLPREGESGDVQQELQLDTRCCMTPALRKIRRETHFVKPDGVSLLTAINKLGGEEIKLYVFEVLRGNPNPLMNLLRVGRSVVRLGFSNMQEALGWYIYIAACANIMSEKDPDFTKVVKQQQGLAEHAAAPHALILQFDDEPAVQTGKQAAA